MNMGHFTMRLNMKRKDEIGEMAVAMDSFSDTIQDVVIGTMNQLAAVMSVPTSNQGMIRMNWHRRLS